MTDSTHDLLTHLWRGGEWAYLWTPDGKPYTDKQTGEIKQGKLSHWFPAGTVAALPKAWAAKNVYFGVHPAQTQRQQWERARLVDVTAINCLFAEFDGKDQVTPNEYTPHLPPDFDQLPTKAQTTAIGKAKKAVFLTDPETYKKRILAHLDSLWNGGNGLPYPSVILDTGGGYHCYWLLENTVTIDAGNREHVKALQAAWVDLVGGDPASKDLARVLRLPGTQNRKTHYAPNFPTVTFVEADDRRLFSLDIFEQFTGLDAAGRAAKAATVAPNTAGKQTDDVIATFNQSHRMVDLLTQAGYTLSFERGNVARLVRPGGVSASVVVFVGDNTSFHHSSSDVLHSEHSHDAFDVWTHLTHNGDTKAAWTAAKKAQGKWEDTKTQQAEQPVNDDGQGQQNGEALKVRLTDLGNAWRFARQHGQNFRFTAGRGWLAWDGKRWTRDTIGSVQRAAKQTVTSLYTEAAAAAAEAERLAAEAGNEAMPDEQRAKLGDRAKARAGAAQALVGWAKQCQSRGRIESIIALLSLIHISEPTRPY